MRYKCVNAVGYEGRLTEGKHYEVYLRYDNGFLVVMLDDGTQGEVLEERFEKIIELSKEVKGEGGWCPCGDGRFVFQAVENCTCHLGHPPCAACVSNSLVCESCGCTPEEMAEPQAVISQTGIKFTEENFRMLAEFKKSGYLSEKTFNKIAKKHGLLV